MNPIVEAHAADPIMGRAYRELAARTEDSASPLAWHRDLARDASTPQRPDPSLVSHLPQLLANCLLTMAEAQIQGSANLATADVSKTRRAEGVEVKGAVSEQTGIAPPHPTERGR